MEGGDEKGGRARGRARSRFSAERTVPGPSSQAGQDETEEKAAPEPVMYTARGPSACSSSSSGDPTATGSSGGSPRGDGSPRGMSPGHVSVKSETADNEAFDYVMSRPSSSFVKTVPNRQGQTRVKLITNYYDLKTHPQWCMSLYAVKVSPPLEDERKIRRLISIIRDKIGSYLLTGFQLFTTRPIANLEPFYSVTLPAGPEQPEQPHTIEIEFKRDVLPSEYIVTQFYNVVIRTIQREMEYQPLGRSFYDPSKGVEFPQYRIKLWPGFQNSIRQMELGLLLNVESMWKLTQTDTVYVIMTNIRRQNPQNYQQAINEALKDAMVVTTYGGSGKARMYKIDHVDFNTTPMSSFPTKSGTEVYVNYYKNKYGVTIKDQGQAMLVSLPKMRDLRRGQTGNIVLVPELCYPCGLTEKIRSNMALMREIGGHMHPTPGKRVEIMTGFIQDINLKVQIGESLKRWGLKIRPDPVEASGRVEKPNDIIMRDGQVAKPDINKADWTMAMRGKKMLVSKALINWALVVTARDNKDVSSFLGDMQFVGTPLGFSIQKPKLQVVSDHRAVVDGVKKAVSEAGGQLDMIMIVLSNNNAETYARVKKCCSIEYGIPSQCILAKNLASKGSKSIATKIVIQINAKQGGIPWSVPNELKNHQVMVLGYDVHHAGAGKTGGSIGAMCATMDSTLGLCFSCVSKLSGGMEVATSVAGLFEKCLKSFQAKNGCLPTRILMYRDGVGEGQLKAVFTQEINAFKDRIKSTYQSGEPPKLTFVVVNKRINSRFYQQISSGQFDNPRPGMIIDDTVTRPERYDFFMISQTARQGCVSPTYYNVLHDESALEPEKLQKFTWKLCHMYYNWSGTVSVPGPCQNAHKLAFLVGTALQRPANKSLDFQLHFL